MKYINLIIMDNTIQVQVKYILSRFINGCDNTLIYIIIYIYIYIYYIYINIYVRVRTDL